MGETRSEAIYNARELGAGKVPAFLGSSFAFLGGYAAVAPLMADGSSNVEMLPYACFGIACSGVLYLIMAALIKLFSAEKIMKYFPPIVTGPIIIAIGLTLSQSAIDNCSTNWLIALATIVEHIGDISAISFTTGINYIKDPGLHRTLLGDGFATIVASLFGTPANTTYGENTGVLNLSKVTISLSGLAVGAIVGILLNVVLPEQD